MKCFHCEDDAEDTIRCAGCGKSFCYDCVSWCHAPNDPPNGDWFCDECSKEAEVEE